MIILVLVRKLFLRFFYKRQREKKMLPLVCKKGQMVSDLIFQQLSIDKPVMICRFGSGELGFYIDYKNSQKRGFQKYLQYIKGDINAFWWDGERYRSHFNNCGLFPVEKATLKNFGSIMEADIKEIDILGSWLFQVSIIQEDLVNAKLVPLKDLEPYYHKDPWSKVLEGKRILVIHPFEESIIQQYAKRKFLFENPKVLPHFDLITLKAVQSIAGNQVEFSTWDSALENMKLKINTIDFDIAIIGCGAYGLHLAAHVKRLGKKSVHLGGATQVLFGIIGKRWENNKVSSLINQYWQRPLPTEVPTNAQSVEGGTYW